MKPLLTFALAAYNQERFIEAAVAGALAQTYSPLEIILSDDCSTDGTFEIIRQAVGRYRGPHHIVLNRNRTNLGLARHVNLVARLAKGELVVAAAGDDISLPQRVSSIFEAWDATGRRATSFHSSIRHIDDSGAEIEHPTWRLPAPSGQVLEQPTSPSQYVATLTPEVFGCTAAWVPALFKTFGDLPGDVIHEDNAITLRSVLLGRVVYLNSQLVQYRLHGNNIFNDSHVAVTRQAIRDQERKMRRRFVSRATMYRVFAEDLARALQLNLITAEEFCRSVAIARQRERIQALQGEIMASNLACRAKALFRLACAGAEPAQLKEMLVRLMPTPVFQTVKLWRTKLLHRT